MSETVQDEYRPGESFVERKIRLAMERGDFADLPGSGRPIEDLDEAYDPLWWVKKWAEREGLSAAELHRMLREARAND